MGVTKESFGFLEDKREAFLYTIENQNGFAVKVTDFGVNIVSLNKKELLEKRKKIGMIFQHFNLLSSRTVGENVAFALEIANWKKSDIDYQVDYELVWK